MKKKIVSILLVATMIITFVGCGNNETNKDADKANDSVSTENKNEDEKDVDAEEQNILSVDDVRKHKESEASDFFCDDKGNGELILVEYLGDAEIVVVPEKINGKPIVSIGQMVFANNDIIKGVKLPDTVQELEKGAFGVSKNLQIVLCGSGIKTVGEACFQRCDSLHYVEFSESLETIGKMAFSYSTNLKEIVIPESVVMIDNSFFSTADDLTITGKAGSVAETYANENNINFQAK